MTTDSTSKSLAPVAYDGIMISRYHGTDFGAQTANGANLHGYFAGRPGLIHRTDRFLSRR